MTFSFITYPLSPKIKPTLTVYANVSKLPPPPPSYFQGSATVRQPSVSFREIKL